MLAKGLKYFLKYWSPVIVWAGVIFFFSSLQTKKTTAFFLLDFVIKKSAHLGEYAIFASLLYRAFRSYELKRIKAGVLAVIIAVIYAVSDEVHQSFTPGREPTLRDIFIDTIGASGAMFAIWNILPKAPKRLRDLAKSWHLL